MSDSEKPNSTENSKTAADKAGATKSEQAASQPQAKDSATAKDQATNTGNAGAKTKSASGKSLVKKSTASDKANGRRRFPVTATIGLLVAIGVGTASYFNYNRTEVAQQHRQTLEQQDAALKQQLQALQQQLARLGEQNQTLQNELEHQTGSVRSEQRLVQDSVNQLSQQLQAMSADKGKDPLMWRLAEVEYLLSVANHRVLLEKDVQTALIALDDADKRLEAIGDPALIPIRQLISGEMTALQSVDQPDITGMALRLSSLVESIQTLPLVNRERLQAETKTADDAEVVGSVDEFMQKILSDLKGVVTYRRSDTPIEPLLPPDEQHYLSQNLGLKLEESRIALLRRDTPIFRQHLGDTKKWVEQYFDKGATRVENVIATVTELQSVELSPEIPDISASLRELRRWLSLHQQKSRSTAKIAPQKSPEPVQQSQDAEG